MTEASDLGTTKGVEGILDEESLQVLLVVDFAEKSGSALTKSEVEGFAAGPRRIVTRTPHPIFATSNMFQAKVTTEPVWSFITRARLVRVKANQVKLTRVGQVVLRAAEQRESLANQPEEVILVPGDNWALGDVLRLVKQAGPCLLVDPYCKEPQLSDLAKFTDTTRVLIGTAGKSENFDLTLRTVELPRTLTLRVSPNVHDRYVIPDDGPVMVLGISLNGIGKTKPSILVRLGEDLSAKVRKIHEELWDSAKEWSAPRRAKS